MSSPNQLSFLPDDYLETKRRRRTNFVCALLFLVGIPLLLWFIQRSLASPDAFEAAMQPLRTPFGKLVLFGLLWGYLFHLLAGLRHLALDLHIGITLAPARSSAAALLVLSVLLAIAIAARLW